MLTIARRTRRLPISSRARSATRPRSVVAEKLIPKNHGFGTRRVPLETGYYEVYNQPNVDLVDINDTPIERITTVRYSDKRSRA